MYYGNTEEEKENVMNKSTSIAYSRYKEMYGVNFRLLDNIDFVKSEKIKKIEEKELNSNVKYNLHHNIEH